MTIANRYDPRLVPFTGGHEGKVLRWYRDPTGTPTIGFGFTWGSKIFREWFLKTRGRKMQAGDTITDAEAFMLLKLVIEQEYLPPVIDRIDAAKATVTKHAVAAATDMAYNCGAGALGWSWFKQLLAGDVADSAARYRVTAQTSKGRKLPGLVRRRKEGALILYRNIWPDWVKTPTSLATADDVKAALPDWRLLAEDYDQGVAWLEQLGYFQGLATTDTKAVKAAVLAFQQEHPQLANDGVLGRATLDQLQRVIDLKKKAATTGAAGGGSAATGGAETATQTDITGISDLLIWGGVAVLVIGGAWLAWRYRDELSIAARSLFKRKG
ncbi:peptidoglycan-binding protein [Hoeflea sp. WL0058]|uniref:Lysozyme n=1 Tax=Flavimaribacter sediminis TaxID=2865987 RepID=A0AAE3D0W8_9HYPH|nr:peptidoglycan-binding protein [Flavimaribacter sediminis]MBW8638975.1 peptidoglycan-binding protein [Flavimaribacter sediminis]